MARILGNRGGAGQRATLARGAARSYNPAMSTTVVTVARTLGAGGELIGRAVADRLGFRFVDEEIVARAAEKENVDPAAIADVERRKPFFARLFESFGRGSALEAATVGGMVVNPGLYFPEGFGPGDPGDPAALDLPERYRDLIREAIVEFAAAGRVVIHAHAAGMALAGQPGLLRVLVTAPAGIRAERLAAGRGLDPKQAEKAIRDSDRDRRDYFRRFHQIDAEEPTDYDLVLNTEVVSPERAVAAIVAAAGA